MIKTTKNKESNLEELFIGTAGEVAESFSFNRIVGQLYALLYFSPEPISLDEMAEKLKISKGSASINIRILEDWNGVKKILKQGSRKDYYMVEPDFMRLISERLQHGFTKRLNFARERLNQINHVLESMRSSSNGGSKELKLFYQERFKRLQELYDFLQIFLKILPKLSALKNSKALNALLGLYV